MIVGNDKKVRFWLDSWCKDDPLSVSFPKLFSIAIGKKSFGRSDAGAGRRDLCYVNKLCYNICKTIREKTLNNRNNNCFENYLKLDHLLLLNVE